MPPIETVEGFMERVAGSMMLDDEVSMHRLLDSIEGYSICLLDREGRVASWNRGVERVEGYSREEIVGKPFEVFFEAVDVATGMPGKKLEEARCNGGFRGEGWRLRRGGVRYWASFAVSAIRSDRGRLIGFSRVVRDLTERKRQDDAMRAMEATIRDERDALYAAAESSMDAFYLCDATRGEDGAIEDFVFTFLNSNVEKMVSIPRSKILGAKMCELMPVNRTLGLFERYREVVETGEPMAYEFAISSPEVKNSWIRVQAVKLRDGIAITASDITSRKQAEEQTRHAAQHDPLTGLVNRSLLHDRIQQAMDRAQRYGSKVGIFLLDLDGFKRVNDTMGHAAGDSVLINVAERLKAAVRLTDSVIRIGGDEFVVVMPDILKEADIRGCAEKMLAALRRPIEIDGRPTGVTCSIGLAIFPDHGAGMEELVSQADAAMYQAKRSGKNRLAVSVGHTDSGSGQASEAVDGALFVAG